MKITTLFIFTFFLNCKSIIVTDQNHYRQHMTLFVNEIGRALQEQLQEYENQTTIILQFSIENYIRKFPRDTLSQKLSKIWLKCKGKYEGFLYFTNILSQLQDVTFPHIFKLSDPTVDIYRLYKLYNMSFKEYKKSRLFDFYYERDEHREIRPPRDTIVITDTANDLVLDIYKIVIDVWKSSLLKIIDEFIARKPCGSNTDDRRPLNFQKTFDGRP